VEGGHWVEGGGGREVAGRRGSRGGRPADFVSTAADAAGEEVPPWSAAARSRRSHPRGLRRGPHRSGPTPSASVVHRSSGLRQAPPHRQPPSPPRRQRLRRVDTPRPPSSPTSACLRPPAAISPGHLPAPPATTPATFPRPCNCHALMEPTAGVAGEPVFAAPPGQSAPESGFPRNFLSGSVFGDRLVGFLASCAERSR
jgi:hypothetical protein